MGYQLSVAIGYKDLFDDYERVKIEDLINDIPTKNSLQILGYFMAQLHSREGQQNIQIEFLKMWIGRFPIDIHYKLKKFIDSTSSKNSRYSFIDYASMLILVEKILENHNELEQLNEMSPEQEFKLFKAYLISSQTWIDKQKSNFETDKIKCEEDIIRVLLPSQIPYQEIQELKDFRIQFIKAIYFFKFCEINTEFKEYLNIFLNEFDLPNWQKYIENLLSLYVRKFEELRTPSVIKVPSEHPDVISFLSELSIDPTNYESKIDFLNLREKPIYKIDEDTFVFLNLNFLVDKIYQGIQFDFAKILIKHGAKYKNKTIRNTGDFMGIFGNEFSENGLFYSVMEYCFEKSKYIKLKGEFMKKFINAEPDYYIRDKGKIYLFEFKNVYLNSEIKNSYDLDKIKNEIYLKYVENQQGKAKGISQLINSIKSIRNGEFEKMDSFDYENIIIYPIIVYVDFSLNLPGINYMLNKEFKKRIENDKLLRNIKNLTLIDLDTFIKFQDLFRDGSIKLNNLLNGYFDTLTNRDIFDRIITFNTEIHFRTRKMNYESPKMLMEEVKNIFPEL